MPRGRIILKSISQSKKLSLLKTDGARLLYTWLIPHLDVNGCFSGDPIVIRGQVMTRLNKSLDDIERYLADIVDVGLAIVYECNGDVFLYVPDFLDKQPKINVEREAPGKIPLPTNSGSTPDQLRTNSGPTPTQSKVKESKEKKIYVRTSIEVQLSILLLDLIQKRKPDFKKPDLQKWAIHIDRMIRLDKRNPQVIDRVIRWAQADAAFWQDNILSTEKLRKQFDQLELKMGKDEGLEPIEDTEMLKKLEQSAREREEKYGKIEFDY